MYELSQLARWFAFGFLRETDEIKKQASILEKFVKQRFEKFLEEDCELIQITELFMENLKIKFDQLEEESRVP